MTNKLYPQALQSKSAVEAQLGEHQLPAKAGAGVAILALGFRPFFLLASIFACVESGVWLNALFRGSNPSGGYLVPSLWHAHEMLMGLMLAVIAGFLLTAARNWTKLNTVSGGPLLGLVLLWILDRLALAGLLGLPAYGIVALSVAFPALLALVVGRVIVLAGSRRNYGVVALLIAFTVVELVVGLETTGLAVAVARPALYAALHLMVLLAVVIGGRIIPLFTRNRTGAPTRKVAWLDRLATTAAIGVTLAAVAAQLWPLAFTQVLLAGLALLSGVAQLARMRTWGSRPALRVPMLAVLHVGYAWIGLGQLLLAASLYWQPLTTTVALHALGLGALGTLTVGMMARVSLGHTGREIVASWPMRMAFVAITLATLARLSAALVPAAGVPTTWLLAGGLFAVAYAGLGLAIAGKLWRTRPDGRPG